MPFVKGQSGNPAGRPVGSRNRYTAEMQDCLERCGPAMIERLIELAAEGNMAAMRQYLDRIMGKQRASSVQLPSPESPNYIMDALTEIHRALGAAEIASDEAIRLVDLVGRTARVLAAKAVAVIDFADRLEGCERAITALYKAGAPAAAQEPRSEAMPASRPDAAAIDNNNAETMAPAPAAAAMPAPTAAREPAAIDNNNGITMETAASLDEAVRATLPPRRDSVKDRLLSQAA